MAFERSRAEQVERRELSVRPCVLGLTSRRRESLGAEQSRGGWGRGGRSWGSWRRAGR